MGKQLFICKNCGKEYYSYKKNSNFCSKECKHNYNNILYNCDFCGREFYAPRHKIENLKSGKHKHLYCSRECADKAQYTSVEKTCAYCGKKYYITKSFSEIQKYCSRKCYDDSRSKNIKIVLKKCPYCGSVFETYHKNQIYCSRECSALSQQKRKKCVCENCGKTFDRIISEVDKNNKHFCSKECRYDFIRWNEHDINILKNNYGKIKNEKIQKLLSKDYSVSAIKGKATTLGFGKSRLWSIEEETILFENYSKVPMDKMLELLPNRTMSSILGKARKHNLLSYFYLNNVYSSDEIKYLTDNYLNKTNEELAEHLGRVPYGISQKLNNLGLYRPHEICKDGYKKLNDFVRARLNKWKNEVRESFDYTCCITGKHSNLVVHHCRSFNILIQETIDLLSFEIKDDFSDYSDEELCNFLDTFINLQAYYGEYVCITESIHKLFHQYFGYGDNTIEQWNEFVEKYKLGFYKEIA